MIKLKKLLKEDDRVLITRRSAEERQKNYQIAIRKRIQQIKNGAKGDLNFASNIPVSIDSLPDNFHVQGNLTLVKAVPLKSLPKNLKVDGSLIIVGCKYIKSLPNNLTVGGNLYLDMIEITSLPNNLTVGKDLILVEVDLLTSLPKDLKVGGNLQLAWNPISQKYSAEEIKRMCPGIKGDVVYP